MKKILVVISCFVAWTVQAQNDRITDENNINWAQLFITVPVASNWDLLAEYQWRRTNGLADWQQSLLRGAVQYRLNKDASLALGYGYIETFPYGDYPIAANGTFPEHRMHQQLQLKSSASRFALTQRFRLEQRWLGRRAASTEREIEEWLFSHRFRYLLRLQHPVASQGKLYAALADEIFINAGKNVGVNIFDQNRLMVLMGAKLNKQVGVELGYINQTLMQGRRVNNNTIMQNNNGLMLTGIFNF